MTSLRLNEMRETPIRRLDMEMTPVTHVARVTLPRGSFVWRRPVAIEVRQGDMVRRVRIHDATRRAQVGVILVELALGILAASATRIYSRKGSKR